VACRCEDRADDSEDLRAREERSLLRILAACRAQGRELMLEIAGARPAEVIARLYAAGIRPDWWALEGPPSAALLADCARAIAAGDPHCRGALVVLDGPLADLIRQLGVAAASPVVRGFIAAGSMAAGTGAAEHFRALVEAWQAAKERH